MLSFRFWIFPKPSVRCVQDPWGLRGADWTVLTQPFFNFNQLLIRFMHSTSLIIYRIFPESPGPDGPQCVHMSDHVTLPHGGSLCAAAWLDDGAGACPGSVLSRCAVLRDRSGTFTGFEKGKLSSCCPGRGLNHQTRSLNLLSEMHHIYPEGKTHLSQKFAAQSVSLSQRQTHGGRLGFFHHINSTLVNIMQCLIRESIKCDLVGILQ